MAPAVDPPANPGASPAIAPPVTEPVAESGAAPRGTPEKPGTAAGEAAAAAKVEPKANIRAATDLYRADRDSRRECLEPLSPVTTGLLPLTEANIERWVTRLADHRVLMLSCVDPHLLNTAAHTVPFHARFADHQKQLAKREDAPTVWEILDARTGGPAVVTAYAASGVADRFLQHMTMDPFWLSNIHSKLEASATRLLVLTTPRSAMAAGFDCDRHEWTETVHDFVGPRLRAAFGAEAGALEADFTRQRLAGRWGDSDERCLDLLNVRIGNQTLKKQIDHLLQVERGEAIRQIETIPDWHQLLNAPDPDERALYELILFVVAFFKGHPSQPLIGLPVDRFDAILRALILVAAEDASVAPAAANEESAARRLERLWVRDGTRLRARCGLQTFRPTPGNSVIVTLGDPLWRDDVLMHFTSADPWLFTRLCGYVRRPEFILGAPDVARGAQQVAVAQADGSPAYDDRVLTDWILPCAPPAATEAERLGALLHDLPPERRATLATWLADVVREWNQPERARIALGRLVDARSHDLAAAVLQRLWRTKEFSDLCLSVAKRLLSEAPSEIKAFVVSQMRGAVLRGDLRLFELWTHDWITASSKEVSLPARVAAELLVDVCQSSIAGARSHTPLRELLQGGDPEQLRALVSWLWHPAVELIVHERAPRVTALPGLWLLPPQLRRRILDEPWEAGQALLTAWWIGFAIELQDSDAITNALPLMFRTLVLVDCVACCADAAGEDALLAAVSATLPKGDLDALRQCVRALDAGVGQAIEMVLALPSVSETDRKACSPRLKLLRDQLRRLRSSTSAPVDARSR